MINRGLGQIPDWLIHFRLTLKLEKSGNLFGRKCYNLGTMSKNEEKSPF